MKESKDLKVIREKIKHFKALENKILKQDLNNDFGKITRRFFDNGFENYEQFKNELLDIAKKYQYNVNTENKDVVSGHQDKDTTD